MEEAEGCVIVSTREGGTDEVILAERPEEVLALASRCAAAKAIAIDVEANGLFAFRPRLCTVQIAFHEGDALIVGVIDTLAADITPLVATLSERGPVKVLHDLTFDARMLEESGAPLGRARDTSVSARLLGYKEGGLAALLRLELQIELDKKYQQHDWARRPLSPPELRYLADDVRYLLALDARLAEKAAALDIEDEIAEECAYKLATAQGAPRDPRPAYARAKGAHALDAPGRAVLRRLFDARDAAAEAADVPPFKMLNNEILLELAKRKPATTAGVRSIVGARAFLGRRGDDSAPGKNGQLANDLKKAIASGVEDGDVPEEHRAHFEMKRLDKAMIARRKDLEARISKWRRAEAKQRGVDEQAVLPGHCAQDLVSAVAPLDPSAPGVGQVIARIPGFGARRMARYGEELIALLTRASAAQAPEGASPAGEPLAGEPVEASGAEPIEPPWSDPRA